MAGDDFYPDLVKEFYANARKWENRDPVDTLNLRMLECQVELMVRRF